MRRKYLPRRSAAGFLCRTQPVISVMQFLTMNIQADFRWTDCFWGALLCLVVPLDWVLSGIIAACVHEVCHILGVLLCKGKIVSVRIDSRGAVLDGVAMEPWQELMCILAGPAGSLMLLVLWEFWPKIALCGAVQGAFNLLPVYPLDGGRALLCMAELLFLPETAARICTAVRHMLLFVLFFLGLVGIFVYDLGIFPVSAMVFFLCRAAFGKIPCNGGDLAVQ